MYKLRAMEDGRQGNRRNDYKFQFETPIKMRDKIYYST